MKTTIEVEKRTAQRLNNLKIDSNLPSYDMAIQKLLEKTKVVIPIIKK